MTALARNGGKPDGERGRLVGDIGETGPKLCVVISLGKPGKGLVGVFGSRKFSTLPGSFLSACCCRPGGGKSPWRGFTPETLDPLPAAWPGPPNPSPVPGDDSPDTPPGPAAAVFCWFMQMLFKSSEFSSRAFIWRNSSELLLKLVTAADEAPIEPVKGVLSLVHVTPVPAEVVA